MKPYYGDILSKIAEEPTWFDEHGVPRYCQFFPYHAANIYARVVVLAEITCQGCRQRFHVAFSNTDCDQLAKAIRDKTLHYGDPPDIGCCSIGPSMTSELRSVVEYWYRSQNNIWDRDPDFEIDIKPDRI